MLDKIQRQLITSHKQFNQNSTLYEYYVSLQQPEKQRKLISWWQNMIETAIRKSGSISLSPYDLEIIFTVNGLKPVPLEKVLEYLDRSKKIQWEGKNSMNISNNKQNSAQGSTGWFGTIKSYIWKPTTDTSMSKLGFKTLQSRSSQQIISISYKNQLLSKIKSIIISQLGYQQSISYPHIFSKLRQQLPTLTSQSLQKLLQQLSTPSHNSSSSEKWMVINYTTTNKKIIMRSNDTKQHHDQKWIQMQKSAFTIKSAIQLFDAKIQQRFKQEDKKLQQAKNYVQSDRNRAKRILSDVRNLKQTTQQLQTRRKLLKQTLDQLQLNQLNITTVDIVQKCQSILQQTMLDPQKLDIIKQQHLQIAFNQKQINNNIQNMVSGGKQLQDQVQNMMEELERERVREKERKNKEIEKEKEKQMQKQKELDRKQANKWKYMQQEDKQYV